MTMVVLVMMVGDESPSYLLSSVVAHPEAISIRVDHKTLPLARLHFEALPIIIHHHTTVLRIRSEVSRRERWRLERG